MRRASPRALIWAATAALFVVGPLGSGIAAVAEDAFALLKQAVLHEGTVDLAGIQKSIVFGPRGTIHEKWLVRRTRRGQTRIEVLAPPQRAGALIINDGRYQYHYFPRARLVRFHPAVPQEVTRARRLEELALVKQNFEITRAGTEVVAGRRAHVIIVKRRNGALARRVYVDAERQVELKVDQFGPHGAALSSTFFTDITFSPVFGPSDFIWVTPWGVRQQPMMYLGVGLPLAAAEARAGFKARVPTHLPAGFKFLADDVTIPEFGRQKVLWLRFSNGLESFSLFERPARHSSPPMLPPGAISWNAGGMNFTLVGRLPRDEVRRLQASIPSK